MMKEHPCFFLFFLFLSFSNNCIVPLGFLPRKVWVAFSREASCDSGATQPTVHAWYFSVSIILNTDMDYRIFSMCTDVNACRGARTSKESLH